MSTWVTVMCRKAGSFCGKAKDSGLWSLIWKIKMSLKFGSIKTHSKKKTLHYLSLIRFYVCFTSLFSCGTWFYDDRFSLSVTSTVQFLPEFWLIFLSPISPLLLIFCGLCFCSCYVDSPEFITPQDTKIGTGDGLKPLLTAVPQACFFGSEANVLLVDSGE